MVCKVSMDLIQMLESRNLGLITRKIFSLLPLHELRSCAQVSKLWESILFERMLIRERPEKTKSKWLQGRVKVSKLLDAVYTNCSNKICRSGYTFFFDELNLKADSSEPIMVPVYCGPEFVKRVALQYSRADGEFENELVDHWFLEALDVLDYEDKNFLVISRLSPKFKEKDMKKAYGSEGNYHCMYCTVRSIHTTVPSYVLASYIQYSSTY